MPFVISKLAGFSIQISFCFQRTTPEIMGVCTNSFHVMLTRDIYRFKSVCFWVSNSVFELRQTFDGSCMKALPAQVSQQS